MTTVHYQFSEPEVVRAMLKVRRWIHPWEMVKGTVAGTLGVALVLGVHIHRDGGRRPELVIIGIGVVLCLLPVFYFATWFRIRNATVRVARGKAQMTSPAELSFDDTKFALSSPSQRQEFTWTVFPHRRQDNLCFYLFSGAGGIFTIFPKRVFDETSLAEFLRCGQIPPPV